MAYWFFINENGIKQGPVNDRQLMEYAKQGVIFPETKMETMEGQKGTAQQIPGLVFGKKQTGVKNDLSKLTQSNSYSPIPDIAPIIPPKPQNKLIRNPQENRSAPMNGVSQNTDDFSYSLQDNLQSPGDNFSDPMSNMFAGIGNNPSGQVLGGAAYSTNGNPDGQKENYAETDPSRLIRFVLTEEQKPFHFFGWLGDLLLKNFQFPKVNYLICQIIYILSIVGLLLSLLGYTVICGIAIVKMNGEIESMLLSLLALVWHWTVTILSFIGVRLLLEFWLLFVDWILVSTEAAKAILRERNG